MQFEFFELCMITSPVLKKTQTEGEEKKVNLTTGTQMPDLWFTLY